MCLSSPERILGVEARSKGLTITVTEAVNETSPALGPTFRMAIMAGAVEAVRLHIARGDRLDARDAGGMTPFLLACSRNKLLVCRLLLDAGADPWLLTPSGATALDVAKAAGATEVVGLLQQLLATHDGRQRPRGDVPVIDEADGVGAPHTQEPELFEPDGWEPEPELVAPVVDPRIREELEAAQAAISRHVPQDDSAEWDDVDVLLPDRASLLLNPEDPESIGRLRAVFLRAIREGSVPEQLVEELVGTAAGEADPDTTRSLRLAIQDLGAECDERFEYSTPWENFRVHVDPEERQDEEVAVADAIAFVESLTAPRNDPLRLYQREFARLPLLTPDEEVTLGQTMEHGIARACDALASWSEGLSWIVDAVAKVVAGERPVRWLRAGAADVPGAPQDGEGEEGMSAAELTADMILHPAADESAGEAATDDNPDTALAPQRLAGEPPEAAAGVLDTLFADMIGRRGMTPDAARRALLATEPFNKYPTLVSRLKGEGDRHRWRQAGARLDSRRPLHQLLCPHQQDVRHPHADGAVVRLQARLSRPLPSVYDCGVGRVVRAHSRCVRGTARGVRRNG